VLKLFFFSFSVYPSVSDRILSRQEPNADGNPREYEYTYRYPDDSNPTLKRLDTSFNSPKRPQHFGSVLGYYQMGGRKDMNRFDSGADPNDYIQETVSLDTAPKG